MPGSQAHGTRRTVLSRTRGPEEAGQGRGVREARVLWAVGDCHLPHRRLTETEPGDCGFPLCRDPAAVGRSGSTEPGQAPNTRGRVPGALPPWVHTQPQLWLAGADGGAPQGQEVGAAVFSRKQRCWGHSACMPLSSSVTPQKVSGLPVPPVPQPMALPELADQDVGVGVWGSPHAHPLKVVPGLTGVGAYREAAFLVGCSPLCLEGVTAPQTPPARLSSQALHGGPHGRWEQAGTPGSFRARHQVSTHKPADAGRAWRQAG